MKTCFWVVCYTRARITEHKIDLNGSVINSLEEKIYSNRCFYCRLWYVRCTCMCTIGTRKLIYLADLETTSPHIYRLTKKRIDELRPRIDGRRSYHATVDPWRPCFGLQRGRSAVAPPPALSDHRRPASLRPHRLPSSRSWNSSGRCPGRFFSMAG